MSQLNDNFTFGSHVSYLILFQTVLNNFLWYFVLPNSIIKVDSVNTYGTNPNYCKFHYSSGPGCVGSVYQRGHSHEINR